MKVTEQSGPFTQDFLKYLDDDNVVSQELITYYIDPNTNFFVKRTAVRRHYANDFHDSIHVEPLYKIEEK